MTIEALWEDFEKQMIPGIVTPQVRYEMRRIFFYGAWNVLGIVAGQPSVMNQALKINELMTEAEKFQKADVVDPGCQPGKPN